MVHKKTEPDGLTFAQTKRLAGAVWPIATSIMSIAFGAVIGGTMMYQQVQDQTNEIAELSRKIDRVDLEHDQVEARLWGEFNKREDVIECARREIDRLSAENRNGIVLDKTCTL